MSVAKSTNPTQDAKLINDARTTTSTQPSNSNDSIEGLMKRYPESAKGLQSACSISPEFAKRLKSDPEYLAQIEGALKKNPKLFASQEGVKNILSTFEKANAAYKKYNDEIDKLGKEDLAKAMKLHLNALTGDYGTRAQVESAASLFLSYGTSSLGAFGGALKLLGAMNLITPKGISGMIAGNSESVADTSAETQSLAMQQQQANSGR